MTVYLRQWSYEHYFLGVLYLDVPETATEDQVRKYLDRTFIYDNWKKDSLKKLGKTKQKKNHSYPQLQDGELLSPRQK